MRYYEPFNKKKFFTLQYNRDPERGEVLDGAIIGLIAGWLAVGYYFDFANVFLFWRL